MSSALRTLGVIAISCAVIVVLVTAIGAATAAVFGVVPNTAPSTGYQLTNMIASLVSAGIGGYICVWLAPRGRATVSIAGLLAVFIALSVAAGRLSQSAVRPGWYLAIVSMLGAIGLLTGAAVRQAGRGHS